MKIAAAPKSKKLKFHLPELHLWDTYGGSMASGWIRFIMEQYHYNATVIYPQDIDAGNLKAKYDVIIFVGGAIPAFRAVRLVEEIFGPKGRRSSRRISEIV